MSHRYKVLLKEENFTIGAVATTERTESDFTFFDETGGIIAMLNRDLIQGVIRVENLPVIDEQEQTKTIEPPEPPRPLPPANEILPLEKASGEKKPSRSVKQKQETKGSNVHKDSRKHEKLDEKEISEAKTVQKEKENDRLMELRYKDIVAVGLYDLSLKTVLIKKGTLIAKHETTTIKTAPDKRGVREKRSKILHDSAEDYNEEYCVLTEDVLFSSLSQAGCALSGSVVGKHYWSVLKE